MLYLVLFQPFDLHLFFLSLWNHISFFVFRHNKRDAQMRSSDQMGICILAHGNPSVQNNFKLEIMYKYIYIFKLYKNCK